MQIVWKRNYSCTRNRVVEKCCITNWMLLSWELNNRTVDLISWKLTLAFSENTKGNWIQIEVTIQFFSLIKWYENFVLNKKQFCLCYIFLISRGNFWKIIVLFACFRIVLVSLIKKNHMRFKQIIFYSIANTEFLNIRLLWVLRFW